MMIEISVWEYLFLMVSAFIGLIAIGWPLGKWFGKQIARLYIFAFGVKLHVQEISGRNRIVTIKGAAGVKLSDAMAKAKVRGG